MVFSETLNKYLQCNLENYFLITISIERYPIIIVDLSDHLHNQCLDKILKGIEDNSLHHFLIAYTMANSKNYL